MVTARFHAPHVAARMLLVAAAVIACAGCGQSDSDKAQLADQKSRDAQVAFNQHAYAKALEEITAAIALNTGIKRDSALGENYLIQAHSYRELGEYEKALAAFRLALEEFHLSGDQPLERRGRIALARLYLDLGDDDNAVSLASDAAGEGKVFDDTESYEQASMIAAKARHHLKNFDRETSILRELLAGAKSDRSPVYDALVRSLSDAGRADDARLALAEWRTYAAARRDSVALSRAYAAQAYMYQRHARPDSMVRALSQALSLLGGPGTEAFEVELLTALGDASYRSGRFDDARNSYSDAQQLARKVNDVAADQLLGTMLVACDWKRAGARPAAAAMTDFGRRCRTLAASCRQVGFTAGEAFSTLLGGIIASRTDSTSSARELLKHAIELHEQTLLARQSDVPLFSVLRTFTASEQTGWYDPLIRLLCESGNKEQAFEFCERKNLEDFSSFFGQMTFATGRPLVDNTARKMEGKRGSLCLLESDIVDELRSGRLRNLERIETLKRLIPQRLAEYEELGDSLGRSPFRWLLAPGRLRYEECQESLAAHQALVEYAPVDDALFAIVVLRDTCTMKKLSASPRHAAALAQEYMRLLGDPRLSAGRSRLDELSAVLHSMLVEPVLPLLGGVNRCVIVPPVEFGWLPYHTLHGAGGRGGALETQMAVSYLPSAAALTFPSRREQVVGDVVGLGHPGTTQWDVEYELKDIRGFYDKARMLFDTMAMLHHVAQVPYDLLHIAGEFTLDPEVPARSALKLSDGTLASGPSDVPLGTLLSLKPPYTLIFSNVSPNAGGLDRYAPMAFLASGVENFIGTLWQGDRKAKKYFGEVFYSNVMTGVPSSTAYHLAVLAMARTPEFERVDRWGLYYRFGR